MLALSLGLLGTGLLASYLFSFLSSVAPPPNQTIPSLPPCEAVLEIKHTYGPFLTEGWRILVEKNVTLMEAALLYTSRSLVGPLPEILYLRAYGDYAYAYASCVASLSREAFKQRRALLSLREKFSQELALFVEEGGCEWRGSTICQEYSEIPDIPDLPDEVSASALAQTLDSYEELWSYFSLAYVRVKSARERMREEFLELARRSAEACGRVLEECSRLDAEEVFVFMNYSCEVPSATVEGTLGERIEAERERLLECQALVEELQETFRTAVELVREMESSECNATGTLGQRYLALLECQAGPLPQPFSWEIFYLLERIRELDEQTYWEAVEAIAWDGRSSPYPEEEVLLTLQEFYALAEERARERAAQNLVRWNSTESSFCKNGSSSWVIHHFFFNPTTFEVFVPEMGLEVPPGEVVNFSEELHGTCKVLVETVRRAAFGVEEEIWEVEVQDADYAVLSGEPDYCEACFLLEASSFATPGGTVKFVREAAYTLRRVSETQLSNYTVVAFELCSEKEYDEIREYLVLGASPVSLAGADEFSTTPLGAYLWFWNVMPGCRRLEITLPTEEAYEGLVDLAPEEARYSADLLRASGNTTQALGVLLDSLRQEEDPWREKYQTLLSSIPECNGSLCELFPDPPEDCTDCRTEASLLKEDLEEAWKAYRQELRLLEGRLREAKAQDEVLRHKAQELGIPYVGVDDLIDSAFSSLPYARRDPLMGERVKELVETIEENLANQTKALEEREREMQEEAEKLKQRLASLLPLYEKNYERAVRLGLRHLFPETPSFLRSLLRRKNPTASYLRVLRAVLGRVNATLSTLRAKAEESGREDLLDSGLYVDAFVEEPGEDTPWFFLPVLMVVGLGAYFLPGLLKPKKPQRLRKLLRED